MKILFNSYNTTAAGTSNITKFILTALLTADIDTGSSRLYFIVPRIDIFRELKGSTRVKIIKLPVFDGLMNIFFRGVFDMLLFPLFTLVLRPAAAVILANYAPVFLYGKKVVFMRHPYLVNGINPKKKIRDFFDIEAVRRGLFRLTLISSDLIVVQSDYMRRRLFEAFGRSTGVYILPNPVSNLLKIRQTGRQKQSGDSRNVLYVSRFYPHKAHWFLLKLIDRYQHRFREAGIKFYVTVAPSSRSARRFLRELESRELTDIICNIGEVSNEDLAAYYLAARCIFYPSRLETFGNPLLEAMAFKLPMVVPDTGYAHAVCGDAGVYFQPGNTDDACQKLMRVLTDDDIHRQFSQKSARQLDNFPTVENWLKQLFDLIGAR